MKRERKQDRRENAAKHRILAAVILFLISAGTMMLSARVQMFAQWYVQNIYPLLSGGLGRLMGIFPFSVAEICLYLLLAALVISVIFLISRIRRYGVIQEALFAWFSGAILTVAVLAFLYTAGCGINYHRTSFSEQEEIITSEYTADDLKEICIWLTEEVNKRSGAVTRDTDGVMMLEEPEGAGAAAAMESLGGQFESLSGAYPRPKKLILSEILSYQSLSGIYSPFTIEANYNGDMAPYNIPFTACHELSHLRGFMEEKEANFIAFLACIGSERTDFQYSGYLSGWIYCMNTLYRTDEKSWSEVRPLLDSSAENDLIANNVFWDSYEGAISETADRINDTYLKVNGQADGVLGYDRMVDLIVAYFHGFV